MRVIAHDTVVFDDCPRIHDHIGAKYCPGVDDRSRKDNRPWTNTAIRRDVCHGVLHDTHGLQPRCDCPVKQAGTRPVVCNTTKTDNEVLYAVRDELRQQVVSSDYRHTINGISMKSGIDIQNRMWCRYPGQLHGFDNNTRVTATSKHDAQSGITRGHEILCGLAYSRLPTSALPQFFPRLCHHQKGL